MSRYSSSDVTLLASGRYIIRTAHSKSYLAPKGHRNVPQTFLAVEETLPFQWVVLYDSEQKRYSIQIPKQQSYINTRQGQILVGNTPEFFNIISRRSTSGTAELGVCYEISALNGLPFRYNLDRKLKVGSDILFNIIFAEKSDAASDLWVFEEPIASSQPPGIYSLYNCNANYFEYSQKPQVRDRFGLRDESAERWTNFWDSVRLLNKYADGTILYKAIFFGRHGMGWHNIKRDKKKEELKHEDNGDLQWDASLTQDGLLQASNVQAVWSAENTLPNNGGIGIPDVSYCSPLTRCLLTHTITFASQLEAEKNEDRINTVVVDICREIVVPDPESRRRSKAYINLRFPYLKFDDDLHDGLDPLWNGRDGESPEAIKKRAQAVLNKVFSSEAKDKIFVSITGHHDITSRIFIELGESLSAYFLYPGHVVPVICRYAMKPGILDVGLYTIQYMPSPSLYADATIPEDGQPIFAVKKSEKEPTVWFVRCVDAQNQLYVIKYFNGDSEKGSNLYWDTSHDDSTADSEDNDNEDQAVVLSEDQARWKLIPSSKKDVYIIEWVTQTQDQDGQSSEEDDASDAVVVVDSTSHQSGNSYPIVLKDESNISHAPSWKFNCVCGVPVQDWDN